MKIIDREGYKYLERLCLDSLKISKDVILEHGALAFVKNINLDKRDTFAVVCGVSENGAYGLTIARILISYGKKVDIYLVDSLDIANEDFIRAYQVLRNMDIEVKMLETIGQLEDFSKELLTVNTVIDAICGIDYQGFFQGPTEYIIDVINKSRIFTISVDIPSGMDYDTGNCKTLVIRPDACITFEFMKKGLSNEFGLSKYQVIVESTGIPKYIKEKLN